MGLHCTRNGDDSNLEVDTLVICAGQTSRDELEEFCKEHEKSYHKLGGAFKAGELDAKFAIDQGVRLGATI